MKECGLLIAASFYFNSIRLFREFEEGKKGYAWYWDIAAASAAQFIRIVLIAIDSAIIVVILAEELRCRTSHFEETSALFSYPMLTTTSIGTRHDPERDRDIRDEFMHS